MRLVVKTLSLRNGTEIVSLSTKIQIKMTSA